MLDRRLLNLDFIKNLKIGVDGGWWVGDRKHKTTRGWTGGCWHAAPTSGDETKILTVGKKKGHDFVILLTTKNGLQTIFLPKALPHSDKVRFDFFHLEKTYIQDTHTPTREEGRQVNVFSDHAADFTSIKGFNTAHTNTYT